MEINILKLGLVDYGRALLIQEKLHEMRIRGEIADTLVLLEHPPVLTLGRRGDLSNIILSKEELKKKGVSVYEVSRGGDVTYHGPGQLVGYPVMDLNLHGRDIKAFVQGIEEVFISMLGKEYGIKAYRDEKKYTGVWVDESKITAIGIAVKKWVTMHGFAFNINTDMEHFRWINPCGITDRGVTSLQKLSGERADFEAVTDLVTDYFCRIFDMKPRVVSLDYLNVM